MRRRATSAPVRVDHLETPRALGFLAATALIAVGLAVPVAAQDESPPQSDEPAWHDATVDYGKVQVLRSPFPGRVLLPAKVGAVLNRFIRPEFLASTECDLAVGRSACAKGEIIKALELARERLAAYSIADHDAAQYLLTNDEELVIRSRGGVGGLAEFERLLGSAQSGPERRDQRDLAQSYLEAAQAMMTDYAPVAFVESPEILSAFVSVRIRLDALVDEFFAPPAAIARGEGVDLVDGAPVPDHCPDGSLRGLATCVGQQLQLRALALGGPMPTRRHQTDNRSMPWWMVGRPTSLLAALSDSRGSDSIEVPRLTNYVETYYDDAAYEALVHLDELSKTGFWQLVEQAVLLEHQYFRGEIGAPYERTRILEVHHNGSRVNAGAPIATVSSEDHFTLWVYASALSLNTLRAMTPGGTVRIETALAGTLRQPTEAMDAKVIALVPSIGGSVEIELEVGARSASETRDLLVPGNRLELRFAEAQQ